MGPFLFSESYMIKPKNMNIQLNSANCEFLLSYFFIIFWLPLVLETHQALWPLQEEFWFRWACFLVFIPCFHTPTGKGNLFSAALDKRQRNQYEGPLLWSTCFLKRGICFHVSSGHVWQNEMLPSGFLQEHLFSLDNGERTQYI